MSLLLNIITGAPFWVWLLLAYLLFIGFINLKANIIYLPKLFIIPFIFLALQYKMFLSSQAMIFLLYIVLSAVFSFLIHTKSRIEILKNNKSVKMPGSGSTLIILLGFFTLKYFFGYIEATAVYLVIHYELFNIVISACLSGYFIGRAIYCLYKYLKT